jgi:hypothetical protein
LEEKTKSQQEPKISEVFEKEKKREGLALVIMTG